jgi:hypothetical protein
MPPKRHESEPSVLNPPPPLCRPRTRGSMSDFRSWRVNPYLEKRMPDEKDSEPGREENFRMAGRAKHTCQNSRRSAFCGSRDARNNSTSCCFYVIASAIFDRGRRARPRIAETLLLSRPANYCLKHAAKANRELRKPGDKQLPFFGPEVTGRGPAKEKRFPTTRYASMARAREKRRRILSRERERPRAPPDEMFVCHCEKGITLGNSGSFVRDLHIYT